MSGVSDMILVRNELERQLRDADNTPALTANFGRLSALLSEVQAAMSRVRMQPIQTLLGGYDRMIRDISADLGKQVEVEVESGQVELDRELVELLRDPLLHIIRNAIDHGIETPDERRAAGKPVEGRLLLSARQTGNEIRIAILDDGRGIDPDKVVERAIGRGIVTAEQAQHLDRGQKLMLICEPGLSTAPQVTAISGRGVGMDVVRSAIERMGGELRIISVPGDGSRFLIDVPLTLSIVPSITVEAGGQVFAVPRSYVREIVRNGREIEVERIGGLRHVRVRGDLHICVGLGEVLGIGGEHDPERQTLVIIRMIDGTVFALCVDGIADHCDLVIRPVAPQVIGTGMYVGVAQLTDGRPSLMLDLAGVAQGGGIRLDKHARAAHQIKVAVEERSAQLVEMIVFNGLDGVRRATPLTSVERLIEVALADIGQGGGHPHIVFGDAILPLHGFARGIGTDSIDVVVLSSEGTRLAYATAGVVDTADIDLATATGQAGRRLALLEGRTVELLDLGSLAGAGHAPRPTCRLPGGDVWSREVLRPLVEAAGYRVVDDAEADADIEIQLGDDCAEIAGDTLLVGTGGDRGAPVAAIARDDHAALAAALRAANNRRAG